MYAIDERDTLSPLGIPPPDAVDPLPIVLSKDGAAVISYVSFIARKDVCVIVSFPYCHTHRYGPPLAAHPLAARGLAPVSAYEVLDSSWLRSLALPKDKDPHALRWKHFVFTFKSTVFECIARDYGCEQTDEVDDTVRLMSRRLYK